MKNNIKKYIFIIILFLVVFKFNNCFAKSIIINDVNYNLDTNEVLETDTYIYDSGKNNLTLINANLFNIKSSYDLNIILVGNSKITQESTLYPALEANEIVISGDGTLEINSNYIGIEAEKITFDGVDATINTEYLNISSLSNADLILNNSNLTLSSNSNNLLALNSNIYINNSNINVLKGTNLITSSSKKIYINSSNLNLNLESMMFLNYPVYVNGKSKVQVYSSNNSYLNSEYILDDNLCIFQSDDGINYVDLNKNEKSKYILIDYIDDKKKLEDENQKIKEELYNLNLNLESKQQNIVQLEEEVDNLLSKIDNNLNIYNQEIDSLNSELYEKDKEIKLLNEKNKSLNDENKLLNDENKSLNEEINLWKTKFTNQRTELTNLKISIKEMESDKDDISNYNDDSKQNVDIIDNPKTYDGIYWYIVILILSLGCIFFIIYRRKVI